MNVSIIKLATVASVVVFAAIAHAQGIRDAGSKIRGDYGLTQSSPSYYAPRAVYQAPAAVAQAPAERRSFSVQPGQPAGGHSGCDVASPPAAGKSQPGTSIARSDQATRRFSYEPAQPTYRRAPRAYQSQNSGVRDAGSKIRGI